jgi:hypothetical protein
MRDQAPHQALTAQHPVKSCLGVVDSLEVHFAGRDVGEAGIVRSFGGDRRHLRCDVREHHGTVRSHDCGRGDPYSARAAGEFEHALPALKTGGIQHRLRHHGSPRVDVLGKLTPRRSD